MNKAVFAGTELRVMLHGSGAWADEAARRSWRAADVVAAGDTGGPGAVDVRDAAQRIHPRHVRFSRGRPRGHRHVGARPEEFFDRVLAQDWKQVVILGAGHDTRAYGRLEKDRTRVFEVDRAPI